MPPRYSYWTILAGGLPTAFRAAERDELLPTFQRLRARHPDAELKWFQRGKLWDSPEAARKVAAGTAAEARRGRDRNWRPGGEHKDPRQKYLDNKKQRNTSRRHQRFERRQEPRSTERVEDPKREPRGEPSKPRELPTARPGQHRRESRGVKRR